MLDHFDNLFASQTLTPALLAEALSACATESVLLNSERIEQQFGSYGIEILASEPELRRSNLYSVQDGQRICRTYALVRFTDRPDARYRGEQSEVQAGSSLGAVFKSHGWSIGKYTLNIGRFRPAQSEIADLMAIGSEHEVALHVYRLVLARDNQAFDYATILEAHHPDYLTESMLNDIYRIDESRELSAADLAKITGLLVRDSVM